MSPPITLTVTRDFAAPAERVFDAWLDPTQARRFLFVTPDGEMVTCELDPRVGGHGLIVERRAGVAVHHRLKFEVIDRPARLVFLFAADPAEGEWTRVSIAIAPRGEGCRLTLTHEIAPEFAAYERQTKQGWTTILGGLAIILGEAA